MKELAQRIRDCIRTLKTRADCDHTVANELDSIAKELET